MVITPSPFLVLHVFESSFQDCLLHFPRKKGETSRPVDAWLLLLVLENRIFIDTCSLESSGMSPISVKLPNAVENDFTMTNPALSALTLAPQQVTWKC